MPITRVTITGADDSVTPANLVSISEDFPFVEWGILISKSQMGNPRFPSAKWLEEAVEVFADRKIQYSIHLCGRWLRDLLIGNPAVELPKLFETAPRIQLNFHAEETRFYPKEFARFDRIEGQFRGGGHQWIFQHDGKNDNLMKQARAEGVLNSVPLFDCSHGAGRYPEKWPVPDFAAASYGYAGGIGPDNFTKAVGDIMAAVAQGPYPAPDMWIDLETKVRSSDDVIFDIEKVLDVLSQSRDLGIGLCTAS